MININFTSSEITKLEYQRYNFPDPKVQRKLEVLYLKSQDIAHNVICKLCRISPVTLVSYLRLYEEGGIKRLKLNLYQGKVNELNKHAENLEEIFTKAPPHSTKEAAKVIEEHTGIKRGLTQVREFLKSLDFKYRKTASVPGKLLTEERIKEQEVFMQEKMMPILEEAKKGSRDVFFWMPPTSFTDHS